MLLKRNMMFCLLFTIFIFFSKEIPTGQVPMLEVNGEKLCQSLAICQYLGQRSGLAGKDDLEAAKCLMVMQTLGDVFESTKH